MNQHKSKEQQWQEDVARRQRNILFPDTVENEGRFWRDILRGERQLTKTQKIGTVIVLFSLVGGCAGVLLMMVNYEKGALGERVLSVAIPLAGAVVFLLAFMAAIGWQIRREQRRRPTD